MAKILVEIDLFNHSEAEVKRAIEENDRDWFPEPGKILVDRDGYLKRWPAEDSFVLLTFRGLISDDHKDPTP